MKCFSGRTGAECDSASGSHCSFEEVQWAAGERIQNIQRLNSEKIQPHKTARLPHHLHKTLL